MNVKNGDLMRKRWGGEELRLALGELAASGSPVDLSVEEEDLYLHIQQVGGVSDSIIFDLPNHRAGFILDMEFLNRRSTTIHLRDLELQLPWEDPRFCWLPDPGTQNRNGKSKRTPMQPPPRYGFPLSDGFEYSRDLVLNHHLAENGKLTQKPMRGVLLATGGRMPDSLRNGSFLKASLVLSDVEGIVHRGAVTFCVERRNVTTKPGPQNLGLFEPARANHGSGVADPAHQPQTHVRGTMVKLG